MTSQAISGRQASPLKTRGYHVALAATTILAMFSAPVEGAPGNAAVSTLHSYGSTAVDGAGPTSDLIAGRDGNLYGVTANGGTVDKGTFERITPAGAVTILHSFSDGSVTTDGSTPAGGVVQASNGNFYGTTTFGGSADKGAIYRVTATGVVTILHHFGAGSPNPDGPFPTPN